MTAPPDEILALIAVLEADAGVMAAATAGIYGDRVPEALAGKTAPRCVVLRSAGGIGAPSGPEIRTPLVDVWAYGPDAETAKAIALAVLGVLAWPAMQASGGARLYKIAPATEIMPLTEPDTGWPAAWQTFEVTLNR